MKPSKFLQSLAQIADDLRKENSVLVSNKTKGWSIPIRVDKLKEFFGEDAPKVTEDPKWVENFAEAFYRLPAAGRAVISLRYGLFCGASFTTGDVHRMTGLERKEVNFIEVQSRHRIYTELCINDYQEPCRPVYTDVTVKKKIRRSAHINGLKLNSHTTHLERQHND